MTKEQAMAIYRASTSENDRTGIMDTDLANLADAEPWLTPMLMELQAARDDVEGLREIEEKLRETIAEQATE
jgi:hypothetical protein